jgi:hypothetical protein
VGDDYALEFAMQYHEDLFAETPVFFMGINNIENAELAEENLYFNGIIREGDIQKNIDMIMTLLPSANQIVALVDGTVAGKGDKEEFYSFAEAYPELEFTDIDFSEHDFESFTEELKVLDENTVLLFLNMYMDKNGDYYSGDEMVEVLEGSTSIPVFKTSEGGIGEGIFGGACVSFKESGRIIAEMVLDYFEGAPVQELESVEVSPSEYIFDYLQVQEYEVEESFLPQEALLINKEESFFEKNKVYILETALIIFVLCVIIIFVSYDNIKRRRMKKS